MNRVVGPTESGQMPPYDDAWLREGDTILIPDAHNNHVECKLLAGGDLMVIAIGKNNLINKPTQTVLVFTPEQVKVLRMVLFGPSA